MSNSDTSFFGHPRGLATLFFTEMWERFSYYGTRSLLMLFMTALAAKGGLGFNDSRAGAIYALYASMVYLLGLPGGWIADRFLGQQKAVMVGGLLIALGNAGLAIPNITTFYLGLAFISIGTGFLKTNVSTIVGQLYHEHDARRDAGFSIFYMGINVGALFSPLVCGWLAAKIDWHAGFAVASGCMVLGVIQYWLGRKHLGEAGKYPVKPESDAAAAAQRTQLIVGVGITVAILAIGAVLNLTGIVNFTPEVISNNFGAFLAVTVIVVFLWLLVFTKWTPDETKRLMAVMFLFVASTTFWAVFEQAGSTLSLFAERRTDLHILGWEFPAAFFQSVNSLFLVILAPVFAWVWIRLGKNDPSSPVKFTVGLVFVGLGMLLLLPAARAAGLVSPLWLCGTYMMHTIGELCLSPVGLSAMTKLAPNRIAGLTMGIWFLSISVGNYLSGRMASLNQNHSFPTLFIIGGMSAIGAAVIFAMLIRPINRMMVGVN